MTLTAGWCLVISRAASQSVHPGHPSIYEDHVRSKLSHEANCVLAIGGFAHHLDVRLETQHVRHGSADSGMVIRDEDSHGALPGLFMACGADLAVN